MTGVVWLMDVSMEVPASTNVMTSGVNVPTTRAMTTGAKDVRIDQRMNKSIYFIFKLDNNSLFEFCSSMSTNVENTYNADL